MRRPAGGRASRAAWGWTCPLRSARPFCAAPEDVNVKRIKGFPQGASETASRQLWTIRSRRTQPHQALPCAGEDCGREPRPSNCLAAPPHADRRDNTRPFFSAHLRQIRRRPYPVGAQVPAWPGAVRGISCEALTFLRHASFCETTRHDWFQSLLYPICYASPRNSTARRRIGQLTNASMRGDDHRGHWHGLPA